jgi:hypothetical protein
MYTHHFNNLAKGGVRNGDGSISSYRSIGVTIDGRYYLLPTVWDNRILEEDEAIRRAQESGIENFPSYRSMEEGERRYQELHKFMELDTNAAEHQVHEGNGKRLGAPADAAGGRKREKPADHRR